MSNCGFLYEQASPSTGEIGYVGEVSLATVRGKVALAPMEYRRDPVKSPHFKVLLNPGGGWTEAGAVWKKFAEGSGDEFLSITFDTDAMPRPVYVSAFPPNTEEGDEPGRWNIVWSRPRAGNRPASNAAGDLPSDEIPF